MLYARSYSIERCRIKGTSRFESGQAPKLKGVIMAKKKHPAIKERGSGKVLIEAGKFGESLEGADLWGAALQRAALQGADLLDADLRGADLQGANLQGANLQGADLQGAALRGAALDFSCWPLWCGSFDVKVDIKIIKQLAYHFCRLDNSSKSYKEARKALLKLANGFHRIGLDVERIDK